MPPISSTNSPSVTATTTTTTDASSAASPPVEARRLELSVNLIDGSLQTAPLSQVLLATTDGLYNDLYSMVQGELDVVIAPATEEEEATASKKRERMSNLSFAQRRHELSWRLAANGRALQHVAALTAAAAASDLSQVVKTSTTALTHTRKNWIAADEAQDALFFFHAQLFPGRAPPHDIHGAADLLSGKWWDLPRDLLLTTDRYETSIESTLSREEVDERWQLAVRDKLITGEVGWMRQNNENSISSLLWRVSLKGGIVKLTHGRPKRIENGNQPHHQLVYPIEALLTVLPSRQRLVWTLLSVHVHVQAKTGEFNYQLETSHRQRYDLHRIAATAMTREEVRAALKEQEQRKQQDEIDPDGDVVMNGEEEEEKIELKSDKASESKSTLPPARPLNALFQIVHTFSLSWQLEVLSAQAQALRRGVWAASADASSITVTPVQFFEDDTGDVLGRVSISFWKVDDTYGPPSMADLNIYDKEGEEYLPNNKGKSQISKTKPHNISSGQLTLSLRAESNVGIIVSLSGAQNFQNCGSQERRVQLLATTRELLEAASNPFVLSASDALLAATRICAEWKCQAVMKVLQPDQDRSVLPPWISLSMENGNIAVAARISYHGVAIDPVERHRKTILFRIICDARTGGFVVTFSRSMQLLRRLASNDIQASEPMSLRIAALPPNRRRAAGANSTGRIVRDSFDSLTRSLNMLGQRAGVGDHWDDIDDKSALLRRRSILTACSDVKSALSKCCGIAALYGLSPIAIAAATGLEAIPDLAGPVVDPGIDGIVLTEAPPISILMDQEIAEAISVATDGSSKKSSYIEQYLFSISCALSDDGVVLLPQEINIKLESPASFPQRTGYMLLRFKDASPGTKKVDKECLSNGSEMTYNGNFHPPRMVHLSEEASRLAAILLETLDWDEGI